MKRIACLLLLVAATPLAAQNPSDSAQRAERRAEFRQRWSAHVGKELGLTDDQAAKLKATEDRFSQRRRELGERMRAVMAGLHGQLQPGVAARLDSVTKLLDARDQARAAFVQLQRDEEKEVAGYLSPVQRARYALMHDRMHGPGMMGVRGWGRSGGRGRPWRARWSGPSH